MPGVEQVPLIGVQPEFPEQSGHVNVCGDAVRMFGRRQVRAMGLLEQGGADAARSAQAAHAQRGSKGSSKAVPRRVGESPGVV